MARRETPPCRRPESCPGDTEHPITDGREVAGIAPHLISSRSAMLEPWMPSFGYGTSLLMEHIQDDHARSTATWKFTSAPLRELHCRGLIKDCSDLQTLDAVLASGKPISVYAGFDPTAGSLHVGHLATLTVLRVFARHGHEILPVLGTGTAMIGDPTGRTSARKMLSAVDVEKNAEGVLQSIRLALGDVPANVVRNGDWIDTTDLVWFMREIGSRIPLSRLLAQDAIRSRLGDTGISFLEACYPLLQAWDFRHLAADRPVLLQVGGSDQFGNICMGLELLSRSDTGDRRAFGLTHPLLTNANGEKMGKTSGGAVWLNPDALDAYGFYRFWRTMPDVDVVRVARMLSDLDHTKIAAAEREGGMAIDRLKADLAFAMTMAIRGHDAAVEAVTASKGRGSIAAGLATTDANPEDATDLAALMVTVGLAASKGAARRLAAQGGLRINGQQRADMTLNEADLASGVVVLSAGKTQHHAIRFGGKECTMVQKPLSH